MSKFTRPEIEVVRFNEADVIVASGAYNMMTFNNFNGTTKGDGYITYMGINYYTQAKNGQKSIEKDLIDALNAQGYNVNYGNSSMFSSTGNSTNTLSYLVECDTTDTANSSSIDGSYYWDGENVFAHKQ